MSKKGKINIQGAEIMFFSQKKEDYISLTDMAKYKNAEIPAHVISHWLSTKYTVEFMGIWETLNIRILTSRNSVRLEMRVAEVLRFRPNNGLSEQMQ